MTDPRLKLILGSPGCGKTTRLLEIVDMEMLSGVAPSRIAFVTFTKAAAEEAKMRAAEKFGLDPGKDLPHFRTIHSLAYGALGLSRDEVMGPRDWKLFGEVIGLPISGHYEVDTPILPGKPGDTLLRIVDYAATTMMTLENAWNELDKPIDWFHLKRFESAFRAYKADTSKMDFTDMITVYAASGDPVGVDVAVIDEAQDLTAAQWAAVTRAFSGAQRIYVGGDDDQAIYRWAGADIEHFLALSGTPEVLGHSHRLPRKIFTLSQRIARRISRRYSKPTSPSDREGTVSYHNLPDGVDLGADSGTWLLLARNTYMLAGWIEMARGQGVNYATKDGPAIDQSHVEIMRLWERARRDNELTVSAGELRALHKSVGVPTPTLRELQQYRVADYPALPRARPWYDALGGIDADSKDYYLQCLRRGTKLSDPPKIRIKTIHGVKGAEADNVAIMSDMSSKTAAGYEREPDHEHRVFYVGVTRARHNLHIVLPETSRGYDI